MSTPPPYLPPEPPASHQAPPGTPYVPATPGKGAAGSEFFRWVRGLGTTRSSDRWIGGVAGGVAARLGVDPLLVRGVFFVAALLGGAGFVLYGIAWALLPEPDGRIHLQQLLRGHFDSAIVGSALFVIAGIGPSNAIDPPWGEGAFWVGLRGVGWVVTIGLLIWLFTSRRTEMTQWWKSVSHNPTGSPGSPGSDPTVAPGQTAPFGQADPFASATPPTSPVPSYGADPSAVPSPLGTPSAASAWGSPASFGATSASTGDPVQDQGYGYGPASSPSAVVATKKPKPAKAKPTGPGRRTVAVVIALAILAVAAILLGSRNGLINQDWKPIAIGAVLVILGLGIVITGLRGRTSGTLGFLAIVAVIAAPSAGWMPEEWNVSYSVGDRDYAWTSRTDAAAGLDLGAGNAVIDLTNVPLTSEPLTVPISVGAGEVTVILPSDAKVLTDVDVRAGEITWETEGEREESNGSWTGSHEQQRLGGFEDDADAQLIVEVRLNAGNVTIQGESS